MGVPAALFDPRWQPPHAQVGSGMQLGAGVGFGAGAAVGVGVQLKWASPPFLHVPPLAAPEPLASASADHEPNLGLVVTGNGASAFYDTIGGANAGDFSPQVLSSTSASTATWPAASLANKTRVLPSQLLLDGSSSASKDVAESANASAAKRTRGEQHQHLKVGQPQPQKQATTPLSYTSSKVAVTEMPCDAYCPMFSLFAPTTAPPLVAPVPAGAHIFPNVTAGITGTTASVLVHGASVLADSGAQYSKRQPTNECAMFKFNESGGGSGAAAKTSLRTDFSSASCSSIAGFLRKSYRDQESHGPTGDARDAMCAMEGHELHQKTASAMASGDEFQVEKVATTIEGEERRNHNMPFETFRPGFIRARYELYRICYPTWKKLITKIFILLIYISILIISPNFNWIILKYP